MYITRESNAMCTLKIQMHVIMHNYLLFNSILMVDNFCDFWCYYVLLLTHRPTQSAVLEKGL